jgi:hypothetical protein
MSGPAAGGEAACRQPRSALQAPLQRGRRRSGSQHRAHHSAAFGMLGSCCKHCTAAAAVPVGLGRRLERLLQPGRVRLAAGRLATGDCFRAQSK